MRNICETPEVRCNVIIAPQVHTPLRSRPLAPAQRHTHRQTKRATTRPLWPPVPRAIEMPRARVSIGDASVSANRPTDVRVSEHGSTRDVQCQAPDGSTHGVVKMAKRHDAESQYPEPSDDGVRPPDDIHFVAAWVACTSVCTRPGERMPTCTILLYAFMSAGVLLLQILAGLTLLLLTVHHVCITSEDCNTGKWCTESLHPTRGRLAGGASGQCLECDVAPAVCSTSGEVLFSQDDVERAAIVSFINLPASLQAMTALRGTYLTFDDAREMCERCVARSMFLLTECHDLSGLMESAANSSDVDLRRLADASQPFDCTVGGDAASGATVPQLNIGGMSWKHWIVMTACVIWATGLVADEMAERSKTIWLLHKPEMALPKPTGLLAERPTMAPRVRATGFLSHFSHDALVVKPSESRKASPSHSVGCGPQPQGAGSSQSDHSRDEPSSRSETEQPPPSPPSSPPDASPPPGARGEAVHNHLLQGSVRSHAPGPATAGGRRAAPHSPTAGTLFQSGRADAADGAAPPPKEPELWFEATRQLMLLLQCMRGVMMATLVAFVPTHVAFVRADAVSIVLDAIAAMFILDVDSKILSGSRFALTRTGLAGSRLLCCIGCCCT